jgi:hypothetical protein
MGNHLSSQQPGSADGKCLPCAILARAKRAAPRPAAIPGEPLSNRDADNLFKNILALQIGAHHGPSAQSGTTHAQDEGGGDMVQDRDAAAGRGELDQIDEEQRDGEMSPARMRSRSRSPLQRLAGKSQASAFCCTAMRSVAVSFSHDLCLPQTAP